MNTGVLPIARSARLIGSAWLCGVRSPHFGHLGCNANAFLIFFFALFIFAINLHAQSPRLLPIQRLTPSTNTPPYVQWVLSTNSFGIARWHVQGSQTLDYCDDVILTWTTQPGRYYSVETGWLNGQPWVTLMPPLLATTNTMGFRTGTKFSSHFFRVRQWP